MINKSFMRVFNSEGNILQGCVWKIELDDIINVEFLNKGYVYASLDYLRKDSSKRDFINEYYSLLEGER